MSLCLFSGLQMCLEHEQLSLCLAWHQWFISYCWPWQTALLCFSCTNYLLFSCMDCQVNHTPTLTHMHVTQTHSVHTTQVHESICICVCRSSNGGSRFVREWEASRSSWETWPLFWHWHDSGINTGWDPQHTLWVKTHYTIYTTIIKFKGRQFFKKKSSMFTIAAFIWWKIQ